MVDDPYQLSRNYKKISFPCAVACMGDGWLPVVAQIRYQSDRPGHNAPPMVRRNHTIDGKGGMSELW